MRRRTLGEGLLVALAVGAGGCASQPRIGAVPAAGPVAREAVVARFATGAITAAELERRAAGPLLAPRQRVYEVEVAILEGMVFDRLVEEAARSAGVSPQAFVEAETGRDLPPVDEARVAELLAQFRAQLPADDTEARQQVVAYLQDEARKARFDALKERLFAAAGVELLLEPPRVAVPLRPDDQVRGHPAAPVTIVEFADFQCPYCRQVQPILAHVLARYPNDVRLIFRHLPLPSHPQARAAASAAACAARQGGFWAFHDRLFAHEGELDEGTLLGLAEAAGLDPARLAACQAEEGMAAVEADLEAAKALGVDATPRFLINGRLLEGFQPLEAFVAVIEDELRRSRGAAK